MTDDSKSGDTQSNSGSTRLLDPGKVMRCLTFVFALGLVAGWIYLPTLSYDLIFDDLPAIVENESIRHLTPLLGRSDEFGPLKPKPDTPVSARPLVNLTLALNYHFGQVDPWGYRLTHIIAHVVVAIIVWRVVSRTLALPYFQGRFQASGQWLAMASAMLWLVHPANTETVVYLTQRTELQMGLFYALTFLLCLYYWKSQRRGVSLLLCLAVGCCSICGMLSKEMMASIPAMVFAFEWTFIGGSVRTILRRSGALYGALMASWLPLAALYAVGAHTPLAGFNNSISATDFWLTQSHSFFVYWRLVVVPWPLLLHYHVPVLTSLSEAWPGVLGTMLYLVLTVFCFWRRKASGFALLWFLAVLSPTLVVPLPHEEISERRLYVPLMVVMPFLVVGGFALVQSAAQRWTGRNRLPNSGRLGVTPAEKALVSSFAMIVIAVTGVFIAVCAVTLPRLQHRSEIWEYVLKYQPENTFAICAQGNVDCEKGNVEQGLEKLEYAYSTDPKYHFFSSSLVRALNAFQRHARLLEICQQLYELFPLEFTRVHALAVALEKNGRLDEAIEKYREAVARQPKSWESHGSLATLLAEQQRMKEALPHFEKAVEIHPDFINCRNLVTAYLSLQVPESALEMGDLLRAAARKELTGAEVEQIERGLLELEEGIKRRRQSEQAEHL